MLDRYQEPDLSDEDLHRLGDIIIQVIAPHLHTASESGRTSEEIKQRDLLLLIEARGDEELFNLLQNRVTMIDNTAELIRAQSTNPAAAVPAITTAMDKQRDNDKDILARQIELGHIDSAGQPNDT
jgi:hypothetical protein